MSEISQKKCRKNDHPRFIPSNFGCCAPGLLPVHSSACQIGIIRASRNSWGPPQVPGCFLDESAVEWLWNRLYTCRASWSKPMGFPTEADHFSMSWYVSPVLGNIHVCQIYTISVGCRPQFGLFCEHPKQYVPSKRLLEMNCSSHIKHFIHWWGPVMKVLKTKTNTMVCHPTNKLIVLDSPKKIYHFLGNPWSFHIFFLRFAT